MLFWNVVELGGDAGGGNAGQMDHRIGLAERHPAAIHGARRAAQRVDGLAEIVEVGRRKWHSGSRGGAISTFSTRWPWFSSSRIVACPALPLPPVTTTLPIASPASRCLGDTTAAAVATGGGFVAGSAPTDREDAR